jgi:hypothetical protein
LNFWHLVSPLTWLSNFFRITNIERISRWQEVTSI